MNDAIATLYDDLKTSNKLNTTTIVIFSEFGRRVKDNGKGTDHGTAAPMFIIGGNNKGKIIGENPDLIIDGIGVEVKAYDTKTITLGKFGTDKETISLLNKVFGTLSLFNEKATQANTGNFKPQDLLSGFKIIFEIYSNDDLRKLDITKPFFSKIDTLYKALGLGSNPTPEEATVALLRKLLWTKLIKKPNMNQEVGYILNVNYIGKGDYTKITSDIISQIPDENLLSNGITVKSSEISMNFNQLFK